MLTLYGDITHVPWLGHCWDQHREYSSICIIYCWRLVVDSIYALFLLRMWPVIWNSLAPRHEPPWPVLYNLEGKILCFLGHRESDLIWLHTSSARVLFSLDQWLCRSIGILTDCLSTVEFSQNKYPLATSFIESPAHVCSTNRPHWDGIPVFTSASSKAPARRTNTSTKMF